MSNFQEIIDTDSLMKVYLMSSTPEYFYHRVKDHLAQVIDKSSFTYDEIISLYKSNLEKDPFTMENELLCYASIISAFFATYPVAVEVVKGIKSIGISRLLKNYLPPPGRGEGRGEGRFLESQSQGPQTRANQGSDHPLLVPLPSEGEETILGRPCQNRLFQHPVSARKIKWAERIINLLLAEIMPNSDLSILKINENKIETSSATSSDIIIISKKGREV